MLDMYIAKYRAKRRVGDHIKHYVYMYPIPFEGNKPIYEEYDTCSKDGEAFCVDYTNPDPSLPIKHYYVVGNRILEGSTEEKTGE